MQAEDEDDREEHMQEMPTAVDLEGEDGEEEEMERLGIRIKGIHGSKEVRARKMRQLGEVVSRGEISRNIQTKSLLYVNLKGLTISVANSTPAELLLLSLYQVVLLKHDVSSNRLSTCRRSIKWRM